MRFYVDNTEVKLPTNKRVIINILDDDINTANIEYLAKLDNAIEEGRSGEAYQYFGKGKFSDTPQRIGKEIDLYILPAVKTCSLFHAKDIMMINKNSLQIKNSISEGMNGVFWSSNPGINIFGNVICEFVGCSVEHHFAKAQADNAACIGFCKVYLMQVYYTCKPACFCNGLYMVQD